jgi:hypothetical protein
MKSTPIPSRSRRCSGVYGRRRSNAIRTRAPMTIRGEATCLLAALTLAPALLALGRRRAPSTDL